MALENELQKEGAWAPLTPTKPIPARLRFESVNRELKDYIDGRFPLMNCDPKISVDKNIGYGKDFADNVMAGKFSKKVSSNYEDPLGANNVKDGHEKLILNVFRNVSFIKLILSPNKVNQQKPSEVKTTEVNQQKPSEVMTTSPCFRTPTNVELTQAIEKNSFEIPSEVNQQKPSDVINVELTPPPVNSQAEEHAIPQNIFGIPSTTNITQAIEKNSFEIPSTPPTMNTRRPIQENSFKIPPTQPAADQDIPKNSFHFPAADQDDPGVDKKPRQPQQQRRMKKHRPKVVVDGELRKPRKTPTPKTPKTLKTPKAPKTPKRESCKRGLDFNLSEQDKVKDEEDDRVVLAPKDDLQEKVRNGSKGSENVEDKFEQNQIKDGEDNRVVLVPDDLQEEVIMGSKGSEKTEDEFEENQVKDEKADRVGPVLKDEPQVEVKKCSKGSEDGVQLADISNSEFKLYDLIRKHPTSKRSAHQRKRRFMKVINRMGCLQNSLVVYVRKFQPNQCQKNSRKLGPNFPRIFKKLRMRRQKTTSVEILLSIIASEIGDGQGRDKQTYKRVLSWGVNCRRKRSKTLTRRRILSSPTATISTPNQSLPLLLGQDHVNDTLPSLIDVPIFDQFSPFQDLGIVNLPSPTALALNTESDKLLLPKLDVITPTYMNPNCDQSSPLVQDVGTSSLRIGCEQIIPPSSQEVGIVRQGRHTSMTKSGNKRSKISTPRQNLSSPVKASTDDIEDFAPSSSDFARKWIDGIHGSEAFHLNNESNKQLVVQDQNANRALVKIDNPKKPKVDLDELTLRVWNLLMENKGTGPFKEMGEENEQHWKEQREIFRGRINSFIECLHPILGDRSFSPWKGSVVDSIVGVFLTQNVSDHLSSSAFMNLAAKFPTKTTSETGQTEVILCCQEPVGSNKEADGQLPDEKENKLEMGNQYGNIIKDEIPATKSDLVSDAIPGETLKESFCDGKSDPVSDAIPGKMLKGSILDGNEDLVSDAIPGVIVKGSFYDGKSDPASDAIPGDTLKGSFCDGKIDPVSDAIEGEILKRSFLDGNAAINEPYLRGPQHLDAADHNLQKTPNISIDLNVPLWDPFGILGGKSVADRKKKRKHDAGINDPNVSLGKKGGTGKNEVLRGKNTETTPKKKKTKAEEKAEIKTDWDELRKIYCRKREGGRNINNRDSVDWEAVRCSTVDEISKTIKVRGMNNVLGRRIKEFLDRIFKDHGSLDLEWLRDVPPDKAKEYLLSIDGLGLKSVECVRLLCLHHIAFPVDTNVARVTVRLGWTPIQPLDVMLHELNAYPLMDSIQKYLWPRLCNLSHKELYELHYQMITFGKVFCTMNKPNCNGCPMRKECRHYASAVASGSLSVTKPEEKRKTASNVPVATNPSLLELNFSDSSSCREDHSCQPIIGPNDRVKDQNPSVAVTPAETVFFQEINISEDDRDDDEICKPIIEVPPSPSPIDIETRLVPDPEDVFYYSDEDEIPTLRLTTEEFRENSRNSLPQGEDLSKTLGTLTEEAAPDPVRKVKLVGRLRTVHRVYELPDSHPLLAGFEKRHPDDVMPYLLVIWTSGEAVRPERSCASSSTSIQEFNPESAWGSILIPCRTATGGAFPLNGTYFQVNEVFADDETSREPIRIPKSWICDLRKRESLLYCGSAVTSLKGLSADDIQFCFWKGYICVRIFNRRKRTPQHLDQRFHVNTTVVASEKKSGVLEKKSVVGKKRKDGASTVTPNST